MGDYANFTLYSELNELEDSFLTFKSFSRWFLSLSNTILVNSTLGFLPRSYISVFNSFRSDLDDFQFSLVDKSATSQNFSCVFANISNELSTNSADNLQLGLESRLSNTVSLRSSVRNSVVNSNAFQKVFRPRLDESRALVNSSSFADLGVRQPFLSDLQIPYSQLLGKNRASFFSTPMFLARKHPVFDSISSLLAYTTIPFYDFPFLLAKTSDTMRFTWLDWFSKWQYIEVQPSSVSRYSTLGVPYLRRPFDFNSNTGDKFQDVELYFTRVSRSRRNYLSNWLYSPFMYARSYVWNKASAIDSTFGNLNSQLFSAKYSCTQMHWYWNSIILRDTSLNSMHYSNSGDNLYSKSTWQPRSSIQSYYASVASLIDVLSRREYLYRLLLENRFSITHLPKNLCATPLNPLLDEVKSSFLFSDPSNFSAESSRELLFSTISLFKLSYLHELTNQISSLCATYDIKFANIWPTSYLTYYFLNSYNYNIGQNSELVKNQFRPLKKGITSMLRLHATGAVAMPIEIRLQVLASSRDVIHSWAIPSASVKIDCVPGYTSHKMMKFLLTGVYWGQCQEICGRYHHWMPIVVYFMKRDLFFLWCTHFVFTPVANSTWDISDRKFVNLGRFASYDYALWLSEFGIYR
jgi:heme/copper-type cytochrome/quinol oxidase subunit 2